MKNTAKEDKVSYHRKPDNMGVEEYQVALRRQFATIKTFRIKKLGEHPVFTDYEVYNPETKNTYKVAIRSKDNSLNYCSCLDFKTNGLGTCKHIEAIMHKIMTQPQLNEMLEKQYIPYYTSVYLEYRKERTVKIRIGSENRDEFSQLAQKYFDKNYTLIPGAFLEIESLIQEAASINTSFRCYPDALEYILEVRDQQHRHNLLDNKFGANYLNGAFDKLINANLFPYQKRGIYFASKAGRCLIADEMGLGKTIQAIAVAELMKKEFDIAKVLIVCPTSLKYQWKTEIEKFTGNAVAVIEGNLLKREKQYNNEEAFYKIISYHVVGNDIALLNAMEPDLVILDEAQRIKNWKTKIAQNVKKIVSPYALVLTGTPLENKLEELYSIVQFIDPFRLGPLYRFLYEHQVTNETGKITGYKNLNRIGEILSDIMIRRTKAEVLTQLPERMDKNLFVPMTEKQAELHTEFGDAVARLVNRWKRLGFLPEKDRQRLLILLSEMRMVCDSTFILDQQTRHDTKIDELMCILDEVFESGNEKVVVFSQWERMTRLVSHELDKRSVKYEYLHGGIPSSDRKILFENFNNDPKCRVFLSTDAGGVGLNLQTASLLINLDIPWNPAVLEQRIGRIHRLGQKKNVTIINLIATGTIEHRMLNVLKFKSTMAGGVLDHGEDTIFMGESRFKQFMNEVERITSSDVPSLFEKNDTAVPITEPEEIAAEERQLNTPAEMEKEQFEPVFAGDDDVLGSAANATDVKPVPSQPADLISMGVSFFGKLTETLSDSEATKKLVTSLVAKDEQTGQTYLKIPVENQQVVENTISLLSGFLSALKK